MAIFPLLKSAVLVLVVLSLTLFSADAKSQKQIKPHDKEVIEYWLGGMRGLWFGFHKEFYHNKKQMSAECMSAKAEKEIFEVMYFLSFGELQDIFSVADDLYKLYTDNKENCGFKEAVNEVINKCSSKGLNQCGVSNILANGQKNVFKLIHSSETLVEIFTKSKFTKASDMYETTFELGSEIAETLVSLLGI